jgi:hypothetical protein
MIMEIAMNKIKITKWILISFLSCTLLVGCSTFKDINIFGGKNIQEISIPLKPERSFKDIESLKQNIDVLADVSREIYTTGTNAMSYESEVMMTSAKVLQMVAGLPANSINWRVKTELEKLHKTISEQELYHRKETAKWQEKIKDMASNEAKLAKENSRMSSMIDEMWYWIYFAAVCFVVLCLFAPTAAFGIVRFFINRGVNFVEVGFSQVIDAIDVVKEKSPELAKELLDQLDKKTDENTKKHIKKIKNNIK